MTVGRVAVLRPGDWVIFDGREHQVVALAGTSAVRSSEGAEQVVLGTHLMASPGFTVVDGAPLPAVEPFGLLDGLPASVLEAACEWERHLVEVETVCPRIRCRARARALDSTPCARRWSNGRRPRPPSWE